MDDKTVYQHYRFDHPDGSSKDWAIAVAPPGLRIRYCATGSVARLAEVPSAKFVPKSAEQEMCDRIDKKLAKGYEKLGQAEIEDGRLRKLSRIPWQDLHWEVIAPLQDGPLISVLTRISNQLSHAPRVSCHILSASRDVPDSQNVKLIESTGLRVTLPQQTWRFGGPVGGGLNRDGRGEGRVSIHLGPVPFLILMALDRDFPGKFRFADDDGTAVTLSVSGDDPFLSAMDAPMDEIIEIGAMLELCLGPIRLSDSAYDSTEQTLWF